jgi:(R,R)-butanediol dehydrogenase/meso-butanediol dehydrogenase/diacetyl reductase
MRAVVVEGPRSLAVQPVPDPTPGPGELILRVAACGICGSDLHLHQGGLLPPGSIMGHEFSGEVVESRHGFRAGEQVCALPSLSCGECQRCRSGLGAYCTRQRSIGLGTAPGAFAEYVAISARHAIRLPAGTPLELGALVEPLAVGLHAVATARLRPGALVAILGAGPIGLAILVWARHFGARHAIVCEPSEGRRELARRLGASEAVAPGGDFLGALSRLAPDGPDTVFEAVGVPGLIQQAIGSVGFRGRVIVAGVCHQPDTIAPLTSILKETSLHFVLAYEKDDFQYTVDMLEQDSIQPQALVTDHVALDAVAETFDALARPTTQSKVLVRP